MVYILEVREPAMMDKAFSEAWNKIINRATTQAPWRSAYIHRQINGNSPKN
jgi:hypothetical protein